MIPYSEQERVRAVRAVQRLRKEGFFADLPLNPKKLKGSLREAARLKAKRAVLLLPTELEQGIFVLRDLESGEEDRIPEEVFLGEAGRFLDKDPVDR